MAFVREHRAATAVGVVAALAASFVVVLALRADGYESRHVDLNDGGVWVTSDADGLFGRLNKPAGSLDLALNPPGGVQSAYHLDVRQSGAAVAAWDQGAGRLMPVDVASGRAISDQAVPVSADEQVGIDGGTVAVLDSGAGRVWADRVDTGTSITSLAGLDPSAKPALTLPKASGVRVAALAVGSDGTIYTATDQGRVEATAPAGAKFRTSSSELGKKLESVQVTVVGSQVVVYDARQGVVYLPGGRTADLPADADAQIQAPSDAGSDVVIATKSALFGVPLSGGKPRTLLRGVAGRPAQPTWLGSCVHAAWAGQPGVYARACDGSVARRIGLPRAGVLADPVFRVNRGSILLNDLALGSVYDLDSLQEVDNWSAVKPPPLVTRTDKDKKNTSSLANRDQPPKAVDDTWGARPGRTTVVHVLDNDSDPQGAILSITRLGAVSDPSASVVVAPDGQSVEVTLPAQNAKSVQFKYTIDDGKGLTAEANVNVEVRDPADDAKPSKRLGFTQSAFTVSSGGTLDLPVLDDWRDFDGDPLVISAAKVDGAGKAGGGGTVTTAPSGRLDFLAPGTGGNETIAYEVSDGSAGAVTQRIPVTVLGPSSTATAPPVANADIARGQVGKPIVIKPLANDLPGADPTNPDAVLALAGTVASPAGVTVGTDLKSGSVTVTGSRAGTFALAYTASFGNAKFAHAAMRVDVAAAPASAQPPVAVPDTGVLYGQTAATIDVLANDFDPAGGVLVVQHAAPADQTQLEVSIVGGRFLRVAARQPDINPNPQVVTYTITNGQTAPVNGELTVIQKPPPADDTPLAVDDYATVRSGDSTIVPVLDNDIDPAGATLALLDDVPGAPAPGGLTVTADGIPRAAAGAAFVSNKQVRYAAPVVTAQTAVSIGYVARNADGNRAAGVLHVTIVPPPSARNPDQAPAAQPISARAVSGATVRIAVPTTGIDPDGDTANVIGIASAPALGRIVSIGSTSITYEAFPTTSGTDRFAYIVSDRFGKTSTATISIGVAQVSDPQPPSAVDDTVTASPGAKVRVDALANDVIAPEDAVSIGNLRKANPELGTPVKLVAAGGPIQVTAPARDGQSVDVQYAVTDGSGDPSVATITVRAQAGYVPAPTVVDVPATPVPGAASTTVDVLSKVTDPQALPVHVAKVFDPQATVTGGAGPGAGKVTLPVLATVQNVVFQVANSRGGTAAAVIHVPARGAGIPYVRANQLITVGRDKARTIALADYVVDPAAKAVRLTTTDTFQTAPGTGLRLSSPDPTHLTITGVNGYNGPAAITFQVTDGTSLTDPNGHLALITVQVQVGPNTPVIRCPSAALPLVEGGPDRRLDIASLCHVWLADRSQLDQLNFTATWTKQPKGVDILGDGSHVIGLRAGGSAVPGAQGTLSIGVKGTQAAASSINVGVLKLGQAAMNPILIEGFKAGATATRDVTGSVTSPLRDPQISIVSIHQSSGMPSKPSATGSRVSITPGADSHGIMTFDLVLTDVADKSRQDRHFNGRLTLEVLNVPDPPGAPQAGRTVLSQTVVLSWPTPAANGAPIDRYEVDWAGGAQTCAASPCRIVNLRNGALYRFTVRAHNGVGFSKRSPALAPAAKPNKLPAAVTSLATSNPQDHAITVSWRSVANGGTAPTSYRVSWSGGGSAPASGAQRSVVARGLDNHNVYTFTVVAVNDLGAGPPATAQGQSAGVPTTPQNVAVDYTSQAGTTSRAVQVTWTPVDANGAGPATYAVTRNGTVICQGRTATSCADSPPSAHTYNYSVVATNTANHRSAPGVARPIDVAGTPDTPGNVTSKFTEKDGQLAISYTVPDSHGQKPLIVCTTSPGGSCGSWTPPAPGTRDSTHTISGLAKDADVVVTLSSRNEQQTGASASAPSAHTSGPPRTPTARCSSTSTGVTFTWSGPGGYNGHPVDAFRVSVDGAAYADTSAKSRDVGAKDAKTHRISVKSKDSRGEYSDGADTASCQDPDPPDPPTVTVKPGTWSNTVEGCTNVGCHAVDVTLDHFKPNQQVSFYRIWLPSSDGNTPGGQMTVTVDGNGHWHGIDQYYGGGDSGGNGHGTVSIYVNGGPQDGCASDWHVESDYTCD